MSKPSDRAHLGLFPSPRAPHGGDSRPPGVSHPRHPLFRKIVPRFSWCDVPCASLQALRSRRIPSSIVKWAIRIPEQQCRELLFS